MSDEIPKDPLTALAQAAVQIHELFLSLVNAGFTEAQAMTLVSSLLIANSSR